MTLLSNDLDTDIIKVLSKVIIYEKYKNYKMFVIQKDIKMVVIIKDNGQLIEYGEYNINTHGNLGLYIHYKNNGYPSEFISNKPGKYV